MSIHTAYADLIRDLEKLKTACEENLPLLPGIEPSLGQLNDVLSEFKTLKIVQEQMEGSRQGATQHLIQLAEDSKETARRVRGFVKSRLGTKSERLPQFGIAPIRRRSTRRPTPNPPELEIPENPPVE